MDRLIRLLAQAGPRAIPALSQGMYEVANDMFRASQRVVPVDTGTLRASGHVIPPKSTRDGVEVGIGYGGAAGEYALIVHEQLDAYHSPPTQAKYLEEPVLHGVPKMASQLARRVDQALRGL